MAALGTFHLPHSARQLGLSAAAAAAGLPGPGLPAARSLGSGVGLAARSPCHSEQTRRESVLRTGFCSLQKETQGEAEDDECPVRKKRLTEAELCAVPTEWLLGPHRDLENHGINRCPSGLSVPSMLDAACEEVDQTTGVLQCEVAGRRLQEIEDRIIDEDEVETDRNVNHLPSPVLSDTMKTGLKREFDEVFTKKMIESMSHPSMELVLWKPLPELLSDKPKPSSTAKHYMGDSQRKHPAASTAFSQRTELFLEPPKTEMPLYNSLETAASTEEEMEL